MVETNAQRDVYRPGEVAHLLSIQPQTLRIWSDEFAEFLSEPARRVPVGGRRPGQRGYTGADIGVLTRAGALLGRHANYAWVRRLLREEILAQGDRDRPTPDWRDHVHADPTVTAGKPVVKSTRLGVAFLLELLAAGWTTDQVLENYPALTPEALRAVFGFAAACVDGHVRPANPGGLPSAPQHVQNKNAGGRPR